MNNKRYIAGHNMEKLAKKHAMTYDYIINEVTANGYPHDLRQIAKEVGLASSSTVHGHLERIEKKGFIRRDPTKPRPIEIIDFDSANDIEKYSAIYATLIGNFTSGLPILTIEIIVYIVP